MIHPGWSATLPAQLPLGSVKHVFTVTQFAAAFITQQLPPPRPPLARVARPPVGVTVKPGEAKDLGT
jgi:hypothetical protein